MLPGPLPFGGTLTDLPELLTPSEVARLFRVDPKTVSRWAANGLLPSVRTLGGHRRFPRADVLALLSTTDEATTANTTQGPPRPPR
ncbi:MAG: BldC family transcriptional regulator [Actinomycetota bacterium]